MTPNGRTRLWMGLALGSVLVVGLSAGLLADRLLAERKGADARRSHAAVAPHDGRGSRFHFDCQDWEDERAAAAGNGALDVQPDADRSEAIREHGSGVTQRMARRLELDPDQVEALEPIVEEAMERSRRYWKGARNDFCTMQRDFHEQVSELLRPEQAARFDEMLRKTRATGHPPRAGRSEAESSRRGPEPMDGGRPRERRRGGHREPGSCR